MVKPHVCYFCSKESSQATRLHFDIYIAELIELPSLFSIFIYYSLELTSNIGGRLVIFNLPYKWNNLILISHDLFTPYVMDNQPHRMVGGTLPSDIGQSKPL
jgi:hypothetical protein